MIRQPVCRRFGISDFDAGDGDGVRCSSTLLGSCRRHGINPFDYLKDLFTRLPAAKITHIQEFTPAEWVRAKDQAVTLAA
jgi:hypothetical protein